jgi:hypothetical protein
MRTVERRKRSATSPNAANAISFRSIGPLGDTDTDFAELAATQQLGDKRLSDGIGAESRMNITGMQHFAAIERKQEVSNQEAGFVRGAIGRNVQNNCGCFSFSVG